MAEYTSTKLGVPSRSRTKLPTTYQHENRTSTQFNGVYVGIVKDTRDIQHMGRLHVFLPDWGGDEDNKDLWKVASYCAPFGGSSPAMERFWEKGINEYDYTPTSYGFWAVPPDVGNKVLIMFINGDESRGIWIGVLYDSFMNFNVPGLASSDTHNADVATKDDVGRVVKLAIDDVHKHLPVTEYNKFNKEVTDPLLPSVRPYHKRQFERMSQTAALEDPHRGWTTSSAQRETPSAVYGMSTPGPIDTEAKNVGETFKRAGGHTFVMDDGDVNGNNRLIRLRARGGAQLLIHDTLGFVYICNKMGTAWVELDRNGNVEVFSNNSISLRANEDINMRADRDFNLDIGRDLNVYMPADYETNEEKKHQTDIGTDFQYSKTAGLKSPVPNGSIILQVKEGEVHTTVETGNVYHTMGAGNYNHFLANGSYYRTINSGVFNGVTASNHYQSTGGKEQHHSADDMKLVSDNWLVTRGAVEVNHSSGGRMNVNVDASLFMSAGKEFHRTAGGKIAEDAPSIHHNDGNSEKAVTFAPIGNTFAAYPAEIPLLQEFQDMIQYYYKEGPLTEKVDRRLTRYPTMEPYGGLIDTSVSSIGLGTKYHLDEVTTGYAGLATGPSEAEETVPVTLAGEPLLVGGLNAPSDPNILYHMRQDAEEDNDVEFVPPGGYDADGNWILDAEESYIGRDGWEITPEAVDGKPYANFSEGQYVGTGYNAKGKAQYKKVGESAAGSPTKAELSGTGVSLIQENETLTQTVQKNKEGKECIGYGHVLNKDKQTAPLVQALTAVATEIILRSTDLWPPFGTCTIGSETISWSNKTNNKLLGCIRGLNNTLPQLHKKGITCMFPGESYLRGITRQQADALFDNDIKKSINAVRVHVKVRINQNQSDALISLAHSMGVIPFSKCTVVSSLNQNNYARALTEFMRYNRAPSIVHLLLNGVLQSQTQTVISSALTRRRRQEAILFCQPATSLLRSVVKSASGKNRRSGVLGFRAAEASPYTAGYGTLSSQQQQAAVDDFVALRNLEGSLLSPGEGAQ